MKKIFLVSIFCFLFDFITKQLVVSFLVDGESIVIIKDFFYLTYAENTGVAFSMLDGNVMFIIIMTLIILGVIFNSLKDVSSKWLEICFYGLIIGGAFGNLFDRVLYGYVVDFLDFHIFGYGFPIFNFADCMIVIGVILLVFFSLMEGRGKNEVASRSIRKSKSR